jgi:class 3 adenylate cyclase/tetratricopeptide (TPR) repeat protein
MQCPRCRAENRAGHRFCGQCGVSLRNTCPSCGFLHESSERFCGNCGKPLSFLSTIAEPGFDSPQSYTPKHLAEKILTSKTALEGERKQVTVLFADMKASMELLADRDPEEAQRILDPVLERMMEAVHRYEGTVNQVMGDGIMCLFGAPVSHEDHALRACYAALRMRETVWTWSTQAALSGKVRLRIGVNSGEVVVRSIGSDLRMDYTAVGLTTHLAARMEQMAVPDTILLAAGTHRLAMDHIVVRPLGRRPVKGLDTSQDVYELVGAATTQSRLRAASARGLSPFVGRERELAQLEDTAAQVVDRGHGQVLAIVGEPGIGKSRLIWEMLRRERLSTWQVVETGCYSYTRTTTDHLVTSLLKAFFRIDAGDTQDRIRERVAAALEQLGAIPLPWRSAMLWLLEVVDDDPDWKRMTNVERRAISLVAIRGILFAATRCQPLLLVLEDLHWIDPASQIALDALVASLPAERALLVVSYRPEYTDPWSTRSYHKHMRLTPLPDGDAEHLLSNLLGSAPSLEPLKRRLIERTQGNPFFLEESARTLSHPGGPTVDGHFQATASTPLDIPPTIHAVLASRIDRLSHDAKHVLQAASGIGTHVPVDVLAAVTDIDDQQLRGALTELQAVELLYEQQIYPEIIYTFHHALTQEVAYESLLHGRRRSLHGRIAQAMEKIYSDRLQDHIEELAQHGVRGEIWERAVPWLRLAGIKAFARSAHRTAIEYFEQAIHAILHLPKTHEYLTLAIDLRFDLRNSLFAVGDHGRVPTYIEEAQSIASGLGDTRRHAWASCYLMMHRLVVGEPRRTIEHGQSALAAGLELGERALAVVANLGIGQAQHALGFYGEAIRSLEASLASLDEGSISQRFEMNSPPAIHCYTWLAWCHAERGEFPVGLVRGQAGLSLANRVQDPWGRASAYYGLGLVHMRRGSFADALLCLSAGLEICNEFGMRTWFPALASALGYTYSLAGENEKAFPWLERAIAEAEQQNVLFRHSLRVGWLGEAHLRAGRHEAAAAMARRALDLARGREEHGHEAYALWLLARTSEDRLEAETLYHEALGRARELGLRPLEAHCYFGIGEMHRRFGSSESARAAFKDAAQVMMTLDMTTWLAEVNSALAELSSTLPSRP